MTQVGPNAASRMIPERSRPTRPLAHPHLGGGIRVAHAHGGLLCGVERQLRKEGREGGRETGGEVPKTCSTPAHGKSSMRVPPSLRRMHAHGPRAHLENPTYSTTIHLPQLPPRDLRCLVLPCPALPCLTLPHPSLHLRHSLCLI